MFDQVSALQPNKLFGQNQTAPLLYTFPATPGLNQGAALKWVELHNRSNAVAVVGVVGHIPDALWIAGQWVNGTTTFTDDTTDAQDSGGDDFALSTLTNNDGHIIGAEIPFNVVSYDVSTAENAGTWEIAYWNGAAWTVLANPFLPAALNAVFQATVETVIAFPLPSDWARGGSGTGVSATKYNLRLRATTAPGATVGLAKRIHIGRAVLLQEAVADNGVKTFAPGDARSSIVIPPQCDGLTMLVAGTGTHAGAQLEALIDLR